MGAEAKKARIKCQSVNSKDPAKKRTTIRGYPIIWPEVYIRKSVRLMMILNRRCRRRRRRKKKMGIMIVMSRRKIMMMTI